MSKFFEDECGQKISRDGVSAEVVDVLKSTYATDSSWYSAGSDWRVPKKDAEGGWASQPELSDSLAKSSLGNEGYSSGLVAEQCSHMSGIMSIIRTIGQSVAEQKVCEQLLKAVFGNQVNQKRYWIPSLKNS
ncbi:hypothetical protein MHLP_03525 [Candidatus Mycoplasma haematolamae str. Purdue]|uniref:Uncharacterized protein n=1 Tax=Mycoplasma haematolamae (strain Purdue) TaxID=1212765 RepID=I7BAF9_MYCHA|nr:hypothetical protein [Candidatus Mycoplasma haematolamae]AFO52285.1 hypothetical protein MHLP_03525 [Candidatus Mycoplasma haematolamae str. Purdue]